MFVIMYQVYLSRTKNADGYGKRYRIVGYVDYCHAAMAALTLRTIQFYMRQR